MIKIIEIYIQFFIHSILPLGSYLLTQYQLRRVQIVQTPASACQKIEIIKKIFLRRLPLANFESKSNCRKNIAKNLSESILHIYKVSGVRSWVVIVAKGL